MILQAENVSKRYFRATGQANNFYAVKNVSIALESGKVTVLLGRSGSGKTTLLHMLSGLLSPTEGKVYLDQKSLYDLDDKALSLLRNREIAVVPQGRSALDTLSVLENILLPQTLYASDQTGTREAEEWIQRLGIAPLKDAMPPELSGGELRRMAIARAMAASPKVLLADEPTGDLDDENTDMVFRAFREAADKGMAVLIVTHETDALRWADQAYRMHDGLLSPLEE